MRKATLEAILSEAMGWVWHWQDRALAAEKEVRQLRKRTIPQTVRFDIDNVLPNDNEWHHIAMTKGKKGKSKFWLDGMRVEADVKRSKPAESEETPA